MHQCHDLEGNRVKRFPCTLLLEPSRHSQQLWTQRVLFRGPRRRFRIACKRLWNFCKGQGVNHSCGILVVDSPRLSLGAHIFNKHLRLQIIGTSIDERVQGLHPTAALLVSGWSCPLCGGPGTRQINELKPQQLDKLMEYFKAGAMQGQLLGSQVVIQLLINHWWLLA